MSEYGCNECPENCRASANKKPICCLYSGVDRARWREVPADTPPKLTAEELARRGIEWPEWAEGAAVTSWGQADFLEQTTFINADHIQFSGRHLLIPGKWDASDWKNSLIPRPEKKLPDWCKVGAWVWWKGASDIGYAPSYMKITGISNEIINCDAIQGIPIAQNQLSEARMRSWTDDELKQQVGKVFEDVNGELHLCLGYTVVYVVFPNKGKAGAVYMAGRGHFAHTAEYLITIGWKLDGSPCGVLEHREGEGWVR